MTNASNELSGNVLAIYKMEPSKAEEVLQTLRETHEQIAGVFAWSAETAIGELAITNAIANPHQEFQLGPYSMRDRLAPGVGFWVEKSDQESATITEIRNTDGNTTGT
jgi:hypothetical protein